MGYTPKYKKGIENIPFLFFYAGVKIIKNLPKIDRKNFINYKLKYINFNIFQRNGINLRKMTYIFVV